MRQPLTDLRQTTNTGHKPGSGKAQAPGGSLKQTPLARIHLTVGLGNDGQVIKDLAFACFIETSQHRSGLRVRCFVSEIIEILEDILELIRVEPQ